MTWQKSTNILDYSSSYDTDCFVKMSEPRERTMRARHERTTGDLQFT